MTPLNNRLKLALINRQKQNNLLQKGFTLVELMIVIVIVGILSAVALPNFLNQTDKAKGTECTSKITGAIKQVSAEALSSLTNADALGVTLTDTETTNSELCDYFYSNDGTADDATQLSLAGADSVVFVTAVGQAGGELDGKYAATACVDIDTTKQDITIVTGSDAITALGATVPGAATTPAAPDCL